MLRAVQAMYTVVKSIIKCHNSLVAKRGPRAPPGQINGTNFTRLRILCSKRILMLPENIYSGGGGFSGGGGGFLK